MTWTVRDGGAADAPACHAVYVDAVRNGTAGHYTSAQARAWAPIDTVEDWMPPRLEDGTTWITETDDRAVGFLTVTEGGHLDLFFVRPEWRKQGVAATLYETMMDWARTRGLETMTTDASHLARSFLERRSWRVVVGETTVRSGIELKRWKMVWTQSAG